MRRFLSPSTPQRSSGPRRATMSGTVMSSPMHQKSPALPWWSWTSIDCGNIPYSRRGVEAWDAVRSASRKRFRPILLTTVTTITGLTPMALGLSGYSKVFGPFAAAIVFGLAVASLLTLFVVPSLYLALDDVQQWLRARRGVAPVGSTGVAVPLEGMPR